MEKEELLAALAVALEEQDHEQLETLAKEAVANYPKEAFGYTYLAESLLLEFPARYPEAEICLAKAIELEPHNLSPLERFAELKDSQGDFEDSQIMWEKILQKDPHHQTALLALGSFAIRNNQNMERGISLLNLAISLGGASLETYLCRAEALQEFKQYAAALEDINHVLAEEFEPIAVLLKIDTLKSLDRLDESLELYEQLIIKIPDDFSNHFMYGKDLIAAKRYQKAIEQLQKAVELQEYEDAYVFQLLGEAAMNTKDYDMAAEAFKECIRLDDTDTESYFKLIEIHILQQKYNEALDNIDKSLQQVDDDLSLKERLLIQKGIALTGLDLLEKAEAILMPIAQKVGLRQIEAYYALGIVFYKKNDLSRAYKLMKAADQGKHPLAVDYITSHLMGFLKQEKEQVLAAHQKAFKKNKAAPFIQKIANKIWVFADLKSQKMSNLPTEFAEKIKLSMGDFVILITATGILFLSKDQKEFFTYQIQKEGSAAALLHVSPLDSLPSFVGKFKLVNDNLTFSKEKNETILLKALEIEDLDSLIIENFKTKVTKEEAAYLGNEMVSILDKIL